MKAWNLIKRININFGILDGVKEKFWFASNLRKILNPKE